MKEFKIQSLAYAIDISNGVTPKKITAEATEEDVAEAIANVTQLIGINTEEFETMMTEIGVEQYCDIKTLRLVKELLDTMVEGDTIEARMSLLDEIILQKVAGVVFNKYISRICINAILSSGLLNKYKDFVGNALQVVADDSVKNVAVFR